MMLHLPRTYRVFIFHGRLGSPSALLNTVFGHLLTTFSSSYVASGYHKTSTFRLGSSLLQCLAL